MSDKNLYEILGVRPDASQAEIRTAYLKLAKQWHPDRNTGNEVDAERRFKEIAYAYGVLSNSDKRAAYDASSQQWSGFDSTIDEADAFDLFISVLLDLAFELAESGADQITIYQALIDMGCPNGTAKTLAQKAHKLGGKSDAGKSSGKGTQSNTESRRGNGGGGYNNGTESTNAAPSEPNDPDATFPAGPWSRWFARSLDLLVGAAVASPLIGLLIQFMWALPPLPSPDRLALYLLAIAPLPFIVDAIIVGVFGNSLGKALLKIKVHSKLTVDGVETIQPIYFDEAIQRNFKIWLKGYWCSIPILAAIPQFLAFLKVSDGKQVPWDMGPDYERVKQTDTDDFSATSIPEKQKFFVLRQKTRWELIAAFVVCVIAAPMVGKVGAEFFVGPITSDIELSIAANPTATEITGKANSTQNEEDTTSEVTFDDSPTDIENAIGISFPKGLNYPYQSNENSGCDGLIPDNVEHRFVNLDAAHKVLISVISFDHFAAPSLCYGLAKIAVFSKTDGLLRLKYEPEDVYIGYGFGSVSEAIPSVKNVRDGVTITTESGDMAQGYASLSIKKHLITSSRVQLLQAKDQCTNPDGETSVGTLC